MSTFFSFCFASSVLGILIAGVPHIYFISDQKNVNRPIALPGKAIWLQGKDVRRPKKDKTLNAHVHETGVCLRYTRLV
jgi:hypothetical protein